MKDVKQIILEKQWAQILKKMNSFPPKKRNKDLNEILNNFNSIPNEVKQYLLSRFIHRCHQKHSLAFYQWRLNYRSLVCEEKELRHSMASLINKMKVDTDISAEVSKLTKTKGHMTM